MLALKDECLHPTTNKPYVKMAMGGKQNSPEGLTVSINLRANLLTYNLSREVSLTSLSRNSRMNRTENTI